MTAEFGWSSTADEVLAGINLIGKRVVVTGVSSGIGVETARALKARGADVVGLVRDVGKGREATASFKDIPPGSLTLHEIDLGSLASVRACADAMNADGAPIDLIICNAAIMACPKMSTSDGFEAQFGTNHLGHFLLVNRLLPLLRDGGRLVNLSSSGHRVADVDLDDPNFERSTYDPWVSYGRAKTANILFAVEFDRRHKGRDIRAAAVHPGGIATNLDRHLPPGTSKAMIEAMNKKNVAEGKPLYERKSLGQGAATSVWAGVTADGAAIGGQYCEDCHVASVFDGESARTGVKSYALDPDRAKALWALSETLVGEKFS
jgi:NAD(P)-dependent dehydrogenase (short-subunit alcohol dehydrogenase family)